MLSETLTVAAVVAVPTATITVFPTGTGAFTLTVKVVLAVLLIAVPILVGAVTTSENVAKRLVRLDSPVAVAWKVPPEKSLLKRYQLVSRLPDLSAIAFHGSNAPASGSNWTTIRLTVSPG